jgi:hypothetical protein
MDVVFGNCNAAESPAAPDPTITTSNLNCLLMELTHLAG